MTKLDFISNDISNMINLKRDSEANITTIVKYYALTLTALFGFMIFYNNIKTNHLIYACIGILFILFTIFMTYYTAMTISTNLKRRILYRREITSLRGIANEKFLDNSYSTKTICALNAENLRFSQFKNLPNIAILLGTVAPILSYNFLKTINQAILPQHNFAFTIGLVVTILVFSLMLNLYSHHRKQMLVAKYTTNVENENDVLDRIYRIHKKRKEKAKYKQLKKFLITLGILFLISIALNHLPLFIFLFFTIINLSINTIIISILSIGFMFILLKRNRYINFAKENTKNNNDN